MSPSEYSRRWESVRLGITAPYRRSHARKTSAERPVLRVTTWIGCLGSAEVDCII